MTRHRRVVRIVLAAAAAALLPPSPLLADAPGGPLCAPYGGLPNDDGDARAGMVRAPGGTFTMGDDAQRPEERLAHRVTVSPFWIDRHEVTNAQFARFVEATGYRTVAERGLDPKEHPELPPELLAPGSMVFSPPDRLPEQPDVTLWWRYVEGADWREPLGPGSSIKGLDNRPVVHVAYEDALAYARWQGRDLPTEAEWEFAARGGLDGATYAWGDSYDPARGWLANSWQGAFPARDDAEDGFHGLAPVGCFAPNGYGLFDMTGNVWEYARDWYVPGHPDWPQTDPGGPDLALAARFAGPTGPSVVIKGGSWLCAPSYCTRYRPAARQAQELGLGTNHVGFRTVLREADDAPAEPPG